ncbi:hypothetical protein B0T17DRAFT_652217 [Bombardia bombarda]|uniref:Uncharacterized protein n=1 Tax=Bombardia bombarda TaxID=252184 RepID=A0AA39X6R3_9PEZI|nr:hypothetical protein B0T17DRAFT_652217 [Bombardia bombarda]
MPVVYLETGELSVIPQRPPIKSPLYKKNPKNGLVQPYANKGTVTKSFRIDRAILAAIIRKLFPGFKNISREQLEAVEVEMFGFATNICKSGNGSYDNDPLGFMAVVGEALPWTAKISRSYFAAFFVALRAARLRWFKDKKDPIDIKLHSALAKAIDGFTAVSNINFGHVSVATWIRVGGFCYDMRELEKWANNGQVKLVAPGYVKQDGEDSEGSVYSDADSDFEPEGKGKGKAKDAAVYIFVDEYPTVQDLKNEYITLEFPVDENDVEEAHHLFGVRPAHVAKESDPVDIEVTEEGPSGSGPASSASKPPDFIENNNDKYAGLGKRKGGLEIQDEYEQNSNPSAKAKGKRPAKVSLRPMTLSIRSKPSSRK